MSPISAPRCDSIVANPTTGKEYRVVGPADEIFPGQFKSPSNCRRGTRLWVLCGFELDDKPILKTLTDLRSFNLIESCNNKNMER